MICKKTCNDCSTTSYTGHFLLANEITTTLRIVPWKPFSWSRAANVRRVVTCCDHLWGTKELLITASRKATKFLVPLSPADMRCSSFGSLKRGCFYWRTTRGEIVNDTETLLGETSSMALGFRDVRWRWLQSWQWIPTVDGWNPARKPVEVGRLSTIIYKFIYTSQVVVWDFSHQQ